MNTDVIRQVLESKIQNEFPALQPSVPIAFLNVRFDTPSVPWIHVAVLPNVVKRANIGVAKEFASWGVINVTCMAPSDAGTKVVAGIADSVWTLLADLQIPIPGGGHITTYETVIKDRGVISGWYTRNVCVSYRARVKLER